jgi:HlyD family secretion protein
MMNTQNDRQPAPRRRALLWTTLPVAILVIAGAITIGTSRLKSAPPIVDRSVLQIETVRRGPLVHHVAGLGTLVPEETRWLAAATDAHVDQVFLRVGAQVKPDSILVQLSNPDLDRQLTDAELSTKKVEAELANLRVQLQVQLLNEHAIEAQLQSDATEAKLAAERDEALLQQGVGAAMNAKISRARADSLATRMQLEKEKLAIAEEARQAQLAAKQAEVAQIQALYELKIHQKESLLVRAGISGILDEISVDAGQQISSGANLARVTCPDRFFARLHIPESQAGEVQPRQHASIQVQDRKIAGRVARVDPNVQNGTVSVDVKVEGAQPVGAHSDLSIDGTIETQTVPSAIYLPRELETRADSTLLLFRVSTDGTEARRVTVQLGRVSLDGVEIVAGLDPGDRVIVSDMSTWNRYDQVRLQ